jgi:hypothetical protein
MFVLSFFVLIYIYIYRCEIFMFTELEFFFPGQNYMTDVLNPKIEAHGLIDVFAIGVSKQVTERISAPYIGNGSITSGLIKGVVGGIAYGKGGRIGNIVASGLIIDAAEDIAVSLLGKIGQGSGGQNQDAW